jgi:hypothetical protein
MEIIGNELGMLLLTLWLINWTLMMATIIILFVEEMAVNAASYLPLTQDL